MAPKQAEPAAAAPESTETAPTSEPHSEPPSTQITPSSSILEAFTKASGEQVEMPQEEAPVAADPKEQNIASLRKSRDELKAKYEELERKNRETEARIPTDYESYLKIMK